MSNTFGNIFKITTYGESHGKAVGVIIDGCPAGCAIDEDFIQREMMKRRPGQSAITTSRDEEDRVEIISGVFNGMTLGSPIHLMILNKDQRSEDYEKNRDVFRPSHADYTYQEKYGIRDYRGGGRSSARETACRVAAGAIAKLLLNKIGIEINGFVSKVGVMKLNKSYESLDLSKTYENAIRCPDADMASKFINYIEEVKSKGDSVGGIVTCVIKHIPVGCGEPIYNKFQASLANAMLSINAVHGFEYGSGFAGTDLLGSEHNDAFIQTPEGIRTATNHSGGIQGGITNGMDVYFNVAFKPTSTISLPQNTINQQGETIVLENIGRHDPCVLPRAVPVVEAMAAIVAIDMILANKLATWN
ncbi:MAG: chorismate synthase [Bacteroidetes bacterium]|nr:chorismate synthase [Bacteroidota bacterium]